MVDLTNNPVLLVRVFQQGKELSIDGLSSATRPGREPVLSATEAALQFGETTVHVLSKVLPGWHTFSQ